MIYLHIAQNQSHIVLAIVKANTLADLFMINKYFTKGSN